MREIDPRILKVKSKFKFSIARLYIWPSLFISMLYVNFRNDEYLKKGNGLMLSFPKVYKIHIDSRF